MRRFALLVPITLLIAVSASVALWSSSSRPAPTGAFTATDVAINPAKNQSSSAFVVTMEAPIAGEKVTEIDAIARLPFALLRPSYIPGGGAIRDIWVSPASVPLGDRSLAMVFEGDVTLIVHQVDQSLDYESMLAQSPEMPFKLVLVNGNKSIGTAPGDQQLQDNSLWHYPGSVEWQIGNLVLTIYGDYSLEELIRVAESVK